MEQMRDFDFVQGFHDVLYALGGLASDINSGLPTTVVGGLVATQTVAPSLSINIASGRIYQFAPSDAVATGSIAQDLNIIVQQGYNPGQTITLTAPSAGQSQWNVVQAQFSQVDAVRDNDPNGGIVPFYNAANPTQPTLNSINTVRKGLCVLQVITGSAATTGSEVPPTPTGGWVPLYMIDLAGGQTQITNSQIKVAGPSVGTGVSSSYVSAPFLAGLLASHHGGSAGQAPKIKLASEVQGILPYANMSSVRTLLNAPLTLYVNNTTGADTNSGLAPGTPFKTIQAAINAMYRNFDFNGNPGSISVANGSYVVATGPNTWAAVFSGQPVGMSSAINLTGNTASPGSVTIGVTNGNGILAQLGANVIVAGFTVTTTGSNIGLVASAGYGISALNGAYLSISNCVIGSCGTSQLWCATGSFLVINGPLTLTGTTLFPISVGFNGTLWANSTTVTVSALVASGGAFASASFAGVMEAVSMVFIGTATGPRYAASLNGVINTGSGNANYFPGSLAGSAVTGGQYA